MLITFDIPNELATRLHPFQQQLSELLELGLHEFNTPKQPGFNGISEILEFLASVPSPEEIIALQPTFRSVANPGQYFAGKTAARHVKRSRAATMAAV